MGSSASSLNKTCSQNEGEERRKQILLQRKVTVDILEKLARRLPTVVNPLGSSLKLSKESNEKLEREANLSYLQEWKRIRKDDATIGNLIEFLRKSGHVKEEYECLFNISREPRNASTVTDTICRNDPPMTSHVKSFRYNPHDEMHHSEIKFSPLPLLLPSDFNLVPPLSPCRSTKPERLSLHGKVDGHCLPSKDNALVPQGEYSAVRFNAFHDFSEIKLHRPVSHDWMDFRNLKNINKTYLFVNNHNTDETTIGNYIPGITTIEQKVIVTDPRKRMIHLFDKSGTLFHSLSTGSYHPGGICTSRDKNLAVCFGHLVALWDKSGRVIGKFGEGKLKWCRGICTDRINRFITTDLTNKMVAIFDNCGRFIKTLQLPGGEEFEMPYHVTVNHKNEIIISDTSRNSLLIFDKDGNFIKKLLRPTYEKCLSMPMGLLTDCGGNVMVCNYGNSSINLFNSEGWLLRTLSQNNINRPVALQMIDRNKLLLSQMQERPLQVLEFTQAS